MLLTVPVLILWMRISQIKQNPQFLLLQEGKDFTISCNSSSILTSFQWYKQRPGGGPVLLISLLKGGEVKQKRLTARFGESRKDSSLHMEASQTADAGTYFCAGTHCSKSTCNWSPNLDVEIQEQPLLSLLRKKS
uniref:Ig-like domain-containing protein n=1 Tax=Neovison vison TaxID=452646 RepID=A0A8C7BM96_NEOVI